METESGSRVIRIGTRKSRLAMAQAMLAADALKQADPEIRTEIVPLTTQGDRILDRSLVEFGGKGVFVSEFEQAIADGSIDLAVHSAKDMPMDLMDGLKVCAVLKREDPRDVFVSVQGREAVHSPMIIGTGSLRRQIQIMERKHAICRLLRGNVNTRLEKLLAGEYDGILLAAAGLKRLGLLEDPRFWYEFLPETEFVPAGGQGIIALEGRQDSPWTSLLEKINDREAEDSLMAERKVLRLMEAGCHSAVGVYSWRDGDMFHIRLMKESGGRPVYGEISGPRETYEDLAGKLVKQMEEV